MNEDMTTQEVKTKKSFFNKKNIVLIVIQALIIVVCLVASIFTIVTSSTTKSKPEDFNTKLMIVQTDSMEPTLMTHTMMFSKKFDGSSDVALDIGTVVTYYVKVGDNFNLITHRIVGYYYYNGVLNSRFKVYGNDELKTFDDIKNKYNGNASLIGYMTRGDKYTLEFGAKIGDYAIKNSDGEIDYNKDDTYYSYLTNDLILSTWSGRQSKFLGNVVFFLRTPNHIMLCIVLPVILLILYNMFLVIKEIVYDKKKLAKDNELKELKDELKLNEEEIKKKAVEEYLASLKNEK